MTDKLTIIGVLPEHREAALAMLDTERPRDPAAKWCLHYYLDGRMGATTPEPAEGAMHDRNVLIGLGATNIVVTEVKP